MQGERDAREGLADRYIDSFVGIIIQLEGVLQREDINNVMGRLSDFDMGNQTKDDLHYSVSGYKLIGERLAEKANQAPFLIPGP